MYYPHLILSLNMTPFLHKFMCIEITYRYNFDCESNNIQITSNLKFALSRNFNLITITWQKWEVEVVKFVPRNSSRIRTYGFILVVVEGTRPFFFFWWNNIREIDSQPVTSHNDTKIANIDTIIISFCFDTFILVSKLFILSKCNHIVGSQPTVV